MRKVKAEVVVIGDGAAAMLAATRLAGLGVPIALVNPAPEFNIDDLRPAGGLCLWNAAYRAETEMSLSTLYDEMQSRLREAFPAPLEQSGLAKKEHWSILSSTPVHRTATSELEREFFKLERKSWTSGQFRLVNPDPALARMRVLGLDLPIVAQVEGAVARAYGLWWDAARMGRYLMQYIQNRLLSEQSNNSRCFIDARIEGHYGRKFNILTKDAEQVSVEAERAVLVFLTGGILPRMRHVVASCTEPWIQGARKRRREQHFTWFGRSHSIDEPDLWMDLGHARYAWSANGATATWSTLKGPDGLERVIDEVLRLQVNSRTGVRFERAARAFRLEWDWKNPKWRSTSHGTFWATAFEGDLWGILELLWNLPQV